MKNFELYKLEVSNYSWSKAHNCYINRNRGRGVTPCWFSFNNSETVKAVNLVFEALHKFSLETFMPNLVSLTCPSLQILDKTQTGIFLISRFLVKSLINKNSQNSRTNDDIDLKLEPVTKLDKRHTMSKKIDNDIRLANYDVIITFTIYGWFRANWNPDSGHMVYDLYIFIKSNLLSYKK